MTAAPAADVWGRYHDLVARRHPLTLTPANHAELLAPSDAVGGYQADRAAALAELAARRGQTLAELADALGLAPRAG